MDAGLVEIYAESLSLDFPIFYYASPNSNGAKPPQRTLQGLSFSLLLNFNRALAVICCVLEEHVFASLVSISLANGGAGGRAHVRVGCGVLGV